MSDAKKEIVFIGGSIEICPAGTYTDIASGETKKSNAKVRLNKIVDKWGNVSPAVFQAMLLEVTKDTEALRLLERIK
jgi:hypothetical protein